MDQEQDEEAGRDEIGQRLEEEQKLFMYKEEEKKRIWAEEEKEEEPLTNLNSMAPLAATGDSLVPAEAAESTSLETPSQVQSCRAWSTA